MGIDDEHVVFIDDDGGIAVQLVLRLRDGSIDAVLHFHQFKKFFVLRHSQQAAETQWQ